MTYEEYKIKWKSKPYFIESIFKENEARHGVFYSFVAKFVKNKINGASYGNSREKNAITKEFFLKNKLYGEMFIFIK